MTESTGTTSAPSTTAVDRIVAVIGGILLAVALFATGLAACCLPATTQLLSEAASAFDTSPYTAEDLTDLAVATRDFTVDNHGTDDAGEGLEDARNALSQKIVDAARNSADDSEKSKRWRTVDKTMLNSDTADPSSVVDYLSGKSDEYALDDAAISHLEDCNSLINTAVVWLWVGVAGCIGCFAALLIRKQRRLLSKQLIWAPIALGAVLLAMGFWAISDFNGFFSAFHGIFFPQGNWTFSAGSLLICMYPIAFWMGMGCLWLCTTALACIISIVVGRHMRRRDVLESKPERG